MPRSLPLKWSDLGALVATPAVLDWFSEIDSTPEGILRRHLSGDWGDIDPEDAKANNDALEHDARLLSAYDVGGRRVWIITYPGDHTTVLFPDEY